MKDLKKELNFRTSRSSGKGGQNVNKVETKVELLFDVQASTILNDVEKKKIHTKLANRIADGTLRVVCQQSRSQGKNKKIAIERFYDLLDKALKKEKKRISTKMPRGVKARIKRKKMLNSEKKQSRQKVKFHDEKGT